MLKFLSALGIAKIAAPVLVIYGIFILWPASHCERVINASMPAYWVGDAIRLGVSPFTSSPEGVRDLDDMPYRMRSMMAGAIARVFYNRTSFERLCATDPSELFRRQGMLDERGLVALTEGQRLPPSGRDHITRVVSPGSGVEPRISSPAPVVRQPAAQPVAAPDQDARTWGQWFWDNWVVLLVLIVGAILLTGPVRKLLWDSLTSGTMFTWMLPPLRRMWSAHTRLFEHFLPRKVVRPSAGKDKTDLTD